MGGSIMIERRKIILCFLTVLLFSVLSVGFAEDPNNSTVLGNDYLQVSQDASCNVTLASDAVRLSDINDGSGVQNYVERLNSNMETFNWYVNSSMNVSGDGKTPQTAYNNIKDAFDITKLHPGDTIYIAAGLYTGESNTGIKLDAINNYARWTSQLNNIVKYGEGKAIMPLNIVKYGEGKAIISMEECMEKYDSSRSWVYDSSRAWVINIPYLNIVGLTFLGNGANGIRAGGGIYFKGSEISIINSTFINNTAERGGALQLDNSPFFEGHILSILNSTFINNQATSQGGAIYVKDITYDSIINATFFSNQAPVGSATYFNSNLLNSHITGKYISNIATALKVHDETLGVYDDIHEGVILPLGGTNIFHNVNDSIIEGTYTNNKGGVNTFITTDWHGTKHVIINGTYIANTDGRDAYNNYFTHDAINYVSKPYDDVIVTGMYYIDRLDYPPLRSYNHIKANNIVEQNITFLRTWYVNTMYSGTISRGYTSEYPFKTLNEALEVAHDGDTIMFAPGTYTGKGKNVDLIINKNLNLQTYGTGDVIFDAESKSRIWTVNASNLNITGITFKNGKSSYGGAIYFNNIIYNSRISGKFINNNATTGNGSAMYFQEAISSLITGKYINNTNYFKKENLSTLYNFNDTITTLNNDSTLYVLNNFIYVDTNFIPGLSRDGFTEFLKRDGYTPFTAFKTLKDALNVAHDGDVILIAPGTYAGTDNIGLNIDKQLSLMSAGNVTFDGHMNSRIWTISSSSGVISNFTIMGITFQNGYSTDEYGGGALLFKNTLKDSVINANFINNRAYYQGGAIAFTKSTNAMDVHMEAFHDPSNIALSNVSITGYFYKNTATDHFIDEWERSKDKPKYEIRGGAIYYSGSVINCSIGGIYILNHIGVFDKDNNMWGGVNCFNGLVQNTSITGYYIINGMDLSNIYII